MHRILSQTRTIALVLGAVLVLASLQGAAAFLSEGYRFPPIWLGDILRPTPLTISPLEPWLPTKKKDGGGGTEVDPSPTATYEMNNIGGGTLLPCEPNPGGQMTKTQWGGSTVDKAARIVISTFGSDFNTAIAAYEGSSCASLKLLKFNGKDVVNDNYAVSGVSALQSLVQFDAKAGTPYRVQIGGRAGSTQTEGDIFATVSVLPPAGGLSVSLVKVGSIFRPGQDYLCRLQFSGASCETATFVVHNSTNKTLTVTPTSSVGVAFINPAIFTLTPGQAKAATFRFNTAFNRTTRRTVSGYFSFVGRVQTTTVSQASYLGLVSVETGAEGPNVLSASVTRQIGTARINGGVPFDVRLTNTGAEAATGCYARSDDPSLKISWMQLAKISPPTAIGNTNVPFAIPAATATWMRVWLASQTARDANTPDFLGEIVIDCANTAKLEFKVSNRFDLTSLGSFALRKVNVLAVSPTSGFLDVPATGVAKFRTSVTNTGPAVQMRLNGFYAGPFEDPANAQFTVTGVCEANAAGACIGSTQGVHIYSAPTNVKKYFNVFVKAPTINPGADAARRRVFLNVQQNAPDNVTQDYVHIGVLGVAVKKL